MKEFDFIIVGAGTAGCTIANRLTAGTSVLLLEAGKKTVTSDKYPGSYLFTINNPKTDWCYVTEEEPGLKNRSIGYARGKVLGGCSSINAMIYMRGQAHDYNHWAQLETAVGLGTKYFLSLRSLKITNMIRMITMRKGELKSREKGRLGNFGCLERCCCRIRHTEDHRI